MENGNIAADGRMFMTWFLRGLEVLTLAWLCWGVFRVVHWIRHGRPGWEDYYDDRR